MIALNQAMSQGRIPGAEIALVISDQAGAEGLTKAREAGLKTVLIERSGRSREEHDREIVVAVRDDQVDFVSLAGYMRLLSPYFIETYRNHILNIHPALLPSFPGLDAQKQALKHGVKWTGCTVHFVDETLDGGPIIAQRIVPVLEDDTEATLSARILAEEHILYAEALALVVGGNYEVVGRRVIAKTTRLQNRER